MEFYFDETLKAKKQQLLVFQMLVGVEIRKIEEVQMAISFKSLVTQSHGARKSNMWWHYYRVKLYKCTTYSS